MGVLSQHSSPDIGKLICCGGQCPNKFVVTGAVLGREGVREWVVDVKVAKCKAQ